VGNVTIEVWSEKLEGEDELDIAHEGERHKIDLIVSAIPNATLTRRRQWLGQLVSVGNRLSWLR
jgi:hypothetical protein